MPVQVNRPWVAPAPPGQGAPLELALGRRAFIPVATLSLCALMIGIHCVMTLHPNRPLLLAVCFVPASPWRSWGFTFLSSHFFHNSWLHLFGNVLGILGIGLTLEHRIRPLRFLSVFVIAGIVGHVFSGLIGPHPTWHDMGASGGLYGLMAFYSLTFRREKVVSTVNRLGRFLHLKERNRTPNALRLFIRSWLQRIGIPKKEITALQLLYLATVLELIGLATQWLDLHHIGSAAHLGGAFSGVACYWVWKRAKKVQKSTKEPIVHRLTY